MFKLFIKLKSNAYSPTLLFDKDLLINDFRYLCKYDKIHKYTALLIGCFVNVLTSKRNVPIMNIEVFG